MSTGIHPHGDHICYCPSCGFEETVDEGIKCNHRICPKCDAQMRAKEIGEFRSRQY